MFEIVPVWSHIPISLPFYPQCEMRGKSVASQCSHDARRELDPSLSRIVESTMYRIYPGQCSNLLCETQASSSDPCRPACETLHFRGDLTHFEVLHVSQAVDHFLRLFTEWFVRVFLPQVGFQRFSIWVLFELMNQLC